MTHTRDRWLFRAAAGAVPHRFDPLIVFSNSSVCLCVINQHINGRDAKNVLRKLDAAAESMPCAM